MYTRKHHANRNTTRKFKGGAALTNTSPLKKKLVELGVWDDAKDYVLLKYAEFDETIKFTSTRKGNYVTYYTLNGETEEELDKIQEAAMAILFASYPTNFKLVKGRGNSYICKQILTKLKKKYSPGECDKEGLINPDCVIKFMGNFAQALNINLIASNTVQSGRQPELFINNNTDKEKHIYFGYDIDPTSKDDYEGASNVYDNTDISVSFSDKIKKYTPIENHSPAFGSIGNPGKRAKHIVDAERAAERAAAEAAEAAASERAAERAAAEAAERAAERASAKEAKKKAASANKPEDGNEEDEDGNEEDEDGNEEDEDGGNDMNEEDERDAAILSEIKEGRVGPLKATDHLNEDFDFDKDTLLTPTQSTGMKAYKIDSPQNRLLAIRRKNMFKEIVPFYLDKCKMLMSRYGLQVLLISPHIAQLIAYLGIKNGPVMNKLSSWATNLQIRTAVQLRNLLARINLDEPDLGNGQGGQTLIKRVNPKNPAESISFSKFSMCTMNTSHVLQDVLGITNGISSPQTVLMSVHRGSFLGPEVDPATASSARQAVSTRDVITSLITYKQSSLKQDDASVEPKQIFNMDSAEVNEEITAMWEMGELAYIDVACSPHEDVQNPFLKKEDNHFKLLFFYTLLNILKTNKGPEMKYKGICSTLIAQKLFKGRSAIKPGKHMLQSFFEKLKFTQYRMSNSGEEGSIFYVITGEEKLLQSIQVLDQMLDEMSSPYMNELCKGGVCK